MKKFIALFAFVSVSFLSTLIHAQDRYELKGTIIDSVSSKGVFGAQVMLLDSLNRVISGVYTSEGGSFNIKLTKGGYNLKVFAYGYAVYFQQLKFSASEKIVVKLSSDENILDEVKILGQSNSVKGTPGAGTDIGAEDIKRMQPIGTQEILETVPGVTGVADDGMGNSRLNIGIRGLPPRRSARVMVLEDGIPIQPAIYTYSNMYYNPPAERIKEVEVVKGSGTIEHGPLTMGGVVNYITSKPRNELGGEAKLTVGTNGYTSGFFEIGGWGKKSSEPEIQLLYKRGNGFRDNNDFQQFNATYKLRIAPDSSDHVYYLKFNTNYELSNATYTGLTEYSFETDPNFNPKKYDEFEVFRTSFDLIHTHQKENGFSTTDKLYVNFFNRTWWRENDLFYKAEDYNNGVLDPVDFLTNGDLVRAGNGEDNMGILRTFYVAGYEKNWSVNHQLGKVDSAANLIIGARLHYEHFDNNIKHGLTPDARVGTFIYADPVTGDTTFYGTSESFDTYAFSLFAHETIHLGRFNLRPGLRIENYYQFAKDHLAGSNDGALEYIFLPGIGFNYQLENGELFSGFHKGFTPASRSSLLVVDNTTSESEVLKPETSWNAELGWRQSKKWIHFEVSGFYLFIHNMLNVSRGTSITNVDLITSKGVENSFLFQTSQFSKVLPDVNITYTLLSSTVKNGVIEESALYNGPADVSGNEIPYAPRHTLVLGIRKQFTERLFAKVDFKYVSKSYSDIENIEYTFNRGDTGPIPEYWIYNATLQYNYKNKWSLSLIGKNLADHIYIGSRLHSSPGNRTASLSSGILPGARRQINLSFSYNF